MTSNKVREFFGLSDNSPRLSFVTVVNTLERILKKKDKERFTYFRNEIMPHMMTQYRPDGAWQSAAQVYDDYSSGKIDDVVSRAVEDVENQLLRRKKLPSFYDGGIALNLLENRKISRQDIFATILNSVEEIRCSPGRTLSKEEFDQRVEDLNKYFKPFENQDLLPETISGWLVNTAPWIGPKITSNSELRESMKQMMRDELLHHYKFNVCLNYRGLKKLGIKHFSYVTGTMSLGEEFASGRVGTIHYPLGSSDSLIKIWNGDAMYAPNWKQELDVVDLVEGNEIYGVVPMKRVLVTNGANTVDGIHMPRIDGISLELFSRMRRNNPRIYFSRGTATAVDQIIETAYTFGLNAVDVNTTNILVKEIGKTTTSDGILTIYGDPIVIDPGSWVTEPTYNEMLRDPQHKKIVQMQTKKLGDINNIIVPNLYRE